MALTPAGLDPVKPPVLHPRLALPRLLRCQTPLNSLIYGDNFGNDVRVTDSSDRSGRDEIYVKPYPQGGIVPISDDGGHQPIWARNGSELFYRNGEKMMVVSVQTGPIFRAETPRLLFEGAYSAIDWTSNYDISPDGQRIVIADAVQGSATTQINVVLNWFEELKRLVPTN